MENIHYSMVIEWDDRDDIFVVTVPELPGCRTHGKTYEEAAERGKEVIESWIEFLRDIGEPIPQPKKFAA
jgi:predicted RNase H-like HicB family nuclease